VAYNWILFALLVPMTSKIQTISSFIVLWPSTLGIWPHSIIGYRLYLLPPSVYPFKTNFMIWLYGNFHLSQGLLCFYGACGSLAMHSSLIMFPLSLWGRYYEQSVVGPNGSFGPHIPHPPQTHPHTPTLLITLIPTPTISSGGIHPQVVLLKSTVMGLNRIEVPQQDLCFAPGREASLWQELDI